MEEIIKEQSKLNDSVTILRKAATCPFNNTSFTKRVAAYARVSTDLECQRNSLETQIESYQRVINEHPGWELVEIYYDKGLSGTAASKRPGFMKMIEDCKAGKIDMIITKSISRFARNTVDTLEYTRKLRELGVGVYFEKERLSSLEYTSEILITILAAFAQEESHSISENIKRGHRQRFMLGIPMFSRNYGYKVDENDKNKWNIVPEEAEIVRKIFHDFNRGKSIRQICMGFNSKGTLNNLGHKWCERTATEMLTNEKYIGDCEMQKSYIADVITHKQIKNDGVLPKYYIKNHHEPIVSKEEFEMAGRILALKNSRHGTTQYPYYDFVKCPECGENMIQFVLKETSFPAALICPHCRKHYVKNEAISNALTKKIKSIEAVEGYEGIIAEATNHFNQNGKMEYYFLKKLIKEIKVLPDYKSIEVTFLFNKTYRLNLDMIHISDTYNLNVEPLSPSYKEKVKAAIKRTRQYINEIEFLPPDTFGIIRAKHNPNTHIRLSRRRKNESHNS